MNDTEYQEGNDDTVEARQRREYSAFLWEHLGQRVSVTVERAGGELTASGVMVAHAHGGYDIGDTHFTGLFEYPIRWAVASATVRVVANVPDPGDDPLNVYDCDDCMQVFDHMVLVTAPGAVGVDMKVCVPCAADRLLGRRL